MPTLTKTNLEGVVIVDVRRFEDERGWFAETYSARETDWRPFVQDNEVWSRRGVVRGLHFQRAPHAQAKLVRVEVGRILDVAVDLHTGRWVGVELSAANGRQLYIPRGYAHGYAVLSSEALVAYKCDDFYTPEAEAGVRFDDPTIGVDWGLPLDEMVVSEKDRAMPYFKEL